MFIIISHSSSYYDLLWRLIDQYSWILLSLVESLILRERRDLKESVKLMFSNLGVYFPYLSVTTKTLIQMGQVIWVASSNDNKIPNHETHAFYNKKKKKKVLFTYLKRKNRVLLCHFDKNCLPLLFFFFLQ